MVEKKQKMTEKLASETKIEKALMEEEVDPSIKEKHKENRVTNVGYEDDFLDKPITDLIKKEVEGGDATKPHFQNSDCHKNIVTMKQIIVESRFHHEAGWSINGIGILEFQLAG